MSTLMINETIAYEYKGVVVYLYLDYETGRVSLYNKDKTAKKYLFSDRTREYLGGWWIILEAMQEAIKYADIRLKEEAECRRNAKDKELINMMMSLSEIDFVKDHE